MSKEYNGWKNYETWNVASWIQNDENLYKLATVGKTDYKTFVQCLSYSVEIDGVFKNDFEMFVDTTPDGVNWNDPSLDVEALNEMIRELKQNEK